MELSDPRLVDRVQWAFFSLLSYRLNMTGTLPTTVNHITVNNANVLSILLACLGAGLLLAHSFGRINPRHRDLKGFVDIAGWGSWLFMPGMLFWVSWTPSMTYGSVYWNYLGLIWYGGVFVMWVIFSDWFLMRKFYFRKLLRLIPRQLRDWTKPSVPPYIQAWF